MFNALFYTQSFISVKKNNNNKIILLKIASSGDFAFFFLLQSYESMLPMQVVRVEEKKKAYTQNE